MLARDMLRPVASIPRLACAAAFLAGGLFWVAPALAAACSSGYYQVTGIVRDTTGRPLADARVFVLLDTISEKKFLEQGVRARSFRTDGAGRFTANIDCNARGGDARNPCAKRPRDVTVAAVTHGYRLRLKGFKLKNLELNERGGGCMVQIPELTLSAER